MNVFTGQMRTIVLDLYTENNIKVICVPATNMTHIFQPLDLTVNGYVKKFTRGKFNDWYSGQIINQLDAGKPLHDIDVPLRLSLLKPLHAQWMVDLYIQMTSKDAKYIIHSGWEASGITDALKSGKGGLESFDPFDDIDPIMELPQVNPIV